MYIEMLEFYENNADFKKYVDANRRTYNRTLAQELASPITQEYYKSLQRGGCNEKRGQKQAEDRME